MSVGAAAAGLLLVAGAACAQQQPAQPAEPQEVSLRTGDGWTIPVTYYASAAGKEAPVVILLHGADGNRNVWRGLATVLQKAGYAVVAPDLRKHGQSQGPPVGGARSDRITPVDYRGMIGEDLEAVKTFLLERHNKGELNIRKTGIIAADDSAPIAVNWALIDWGKEPYPDAPTYEARTPRGQDVRALVLLSPTEAVGGLNMGRALTQLKPFRIAALFAVGEEDREDKKTTFKSYERLTTGAEDSKERVIFEQFPKVKQRGTELLGVRQLTGQILNFLDKNLKQLPDPWQNRESRL
jgi:pimeloyl-ACP methyl ester carboxylesterase